ncbi:MAG: nucleotide sugar dehydrogenase [Acidimicrobiia bacterium]|nr:nucleotide sugar dehydrogenase [Acidimicrobiia bacterium]
MTSTIAVIGTGYVGLTTGACFASLGHNVICADIDADKIERLRRGEIPILEDGLDRLVFEGIRSERLSFVVGAVNAAAEAEFSYLCVPTPQGLDGSADLSYIEAAAAEIGPVLPAEAVVVNKSTVPVGSTRVVEQALGRSDVFVVSNPEFLREGSAVSDFLKPDRVVIGADSQAAAIRVASLYVGIPAPIMVTDPASAETIKYAANAFLATKLSFTNAVAAICEAVGADVNDVMLGIGYDKRIGQEFLQPGPGWGGSCFLGDETLLARRGTHVALRSFEELHTLVEQVGASGWEVLAWTPGDPTPEFHPIAAFTRRPYSGDVIDVRTKMGRRLAVTADHPMVIGDGTHAAPTEVVTAAELVTDDWLPVAIGAPMPLVDPPRVGDLLDAMEPLGIVSDKVIVRLSDAQRAAVELRADELHWTRRRDILRCGAMRLAELEDLGLDPADTRASTVTNGTYFPASIPIDEQFWRVVGLWLAEGHVSTDGRRMRVGWSFHPTDEEWLVDIVVEWFRGLGIEPSVRSMGTTRQVAVSSRLFATWLTEVIGLGHDCYDKRLPDLAWDLTEDEKRALLQGLWYGDGSWSYVAGGPSVVLEYGTVSRRLADGMVRLLAGLGIVARLKVGRSAKSTTDAWFLNISGADQVERSVWLVPPHERGEVLDSIAAQSKRIAPTGYRRLDKNVAWVRVASAERRVFDGPVYSVEVPGPHTVVTSNGLVAHNCFPKDTRALAHIAEQAGYDFFFLKGVLEVNQEQFDRVAAKVATLAGGSVEGKTIAVWGLTFKARTDDMRESPSLEIISRLLAQGARIVAYDPAVEVAPDGVELVQDPYAACDGADVLAVLTEWDEFKWLDFDKVYESMAAPAVLDGRNLLDRAALKRRGFTYDGIGRS